MLDCQLSYTLFDHVALMSMSSFSIVVIYRDICLSEKTEWFIPLQITVLLSETSFTLGVVNSSFSRSHHEERITQEKFAQLDQTDLSELMSCPVKGLVS